MIVSIRDILTEEIPPEFISIDEIENVLNAIHVSDYGISVDQDGLGISLTFNIENTVILQIPGINGLLLLFGVVGRPTIINLYFHISEKGFACEVYDWAFSLQFPPDVLHPHNPPQGSPNVSSISVRGNLGIDEQFNFNIDGFDSLSLSPSMIGNTGLIISANDIKFDFSRTDTIPEVAAAGLDASFMGVYLETVTVRYEKAGESIPNAYVFTISKAAIGDGGFTGEIGLGTTQAAARNLGSSMEGILNNLFDANDNAREDRASHEPAIAMYPVKLASMKMVLQYFGVNFRQSVPIGSQILGYIFIPLANKWVSLRASIGANGDFMLEIGGVGNEGLISLETDVFKVTADSIAYQLENTINYAVIAGSIRLKKPEGLNLPEFRVQKLKIGSNGDVKIEGGWLRAPEQVNIDLGGFKIGIKEIGFGTEGEEEATKRQWVGFSGEVQLIESLPIKGSVDGLKISWLHDKAVKLHNDNPANISNQINPINTVHIELKGIKVAFKIPGALEFDGEVNYDRTTNLFKGHIKVNFISLRFEVEANLIVGKYRDSEGREFGVFYIQIGAKFPVPIVIGATGMGLSGIEGMVGINVAPTKTATEKWYDWYKKDPEYDIVSIKKWAPMNDNYAFGAGVKLETVYDNGTTLNITALLAVLIPGPVIMLQGTVNLLKARSDDKREEGAFKLLAVLDCRAGTFQLNIDVRYSLQDIITIGGGLEAFFNFNDSNDWHIWIGQKDPESKRIRADILKIFSANTYFMIDPHALQLGASVGFNFDESYGPARVKLVARFSFDAAIFFKPFQLEGTVALVADLQVTVLGIGLRLMLEAMLGIKTPKPYEIYGKAKVKLQLFWPIPEVKFEVEFKWSQPAKTYPTWPLLKELEVKVKDANDVNVVVKDAIGRDFALAFMQHHKSSSFEERLLRGDASLDANHPNIPYVPIDSRPRLTFAKSLHYIGKQRINDQPDKPGSSVFWYHLDNLVLEERVGNDWVKVREKINDSSTRPPSTIPYFDLTISTNPQTGDTHVLNDNTAKEPIIELWKYGVWDTLNSHSSETEPSEDPACGKVFAIPELKTITWVNDAVGNLPTEFWKDGVLFVVEPQYINISPFLLDISSGSKEPFVDVPQSVMSNKQRMLRTRTTTLYFPQKIYMIAFVVLFDDVEVQNWRDDYTSINIKAYSTGIIVGTPQKSAANYMFNLSIQHELGFDSVTIEDNTSDDRAFWIQGIVYLTTDRPVNSYSYPSNTTNNPAPTSTRFEAQRTKPILKPATTYRLTVETKVTSDGNAFVKKYEDEQEVDINRPTIDYFYFKTDNGPGFPLKPFSTEPLRYAPEAPVQFTPTALTVAQRDATTPSTMPDAPDSRKPDANIPNPVNLLSTYILGTYPTHGAIAHYFKESIVIAFNEAYLLNMWTGRTLELRLKNRNGHPLPPVSINLTPETASSSLSSMPLLSRGLMVWAASLSVGGCLNNNNSPQAVMAPSLAFPVTNLEANTLYFAELWSNTAVNQPKSPIFDFQFTTSRYPDFATHIAELGLSDSTETQLNNIAKTQRVSTVEVDADQLTQTDRVTAKTSYRAAVASYIGMLTDQTQTYDQDQLVTAYNNMLKLKEDWEKTSATAFDLIYNAISERAFQITTPNGEVIDMRHRGLPEKPEIIQIPLQNTQSSLLLFESPEPLDWANVTFKNTDERTFSVLPNTDKTRAFFIVNNQLGFSPGRFVFDMTFDPFTEYTHKLSLNQNAEAGNKATFTIVLPENYTLIVSGLRMASGQEITSPDRLTKLIYLPTGNLNLLYRNNLIWSSRTEGQPTGSVEMQTKGNFVIYNSQNRAIWASDTEGTVFAGSTLRLHNGGQLAIYTPSQNKNVWATGIVNGIIPKESLQIGEQLLPNQSLWSNNRQFRLTYQQDGNLVLYRNKDNTTLWASGTQGQSAGHIEMKNDGILAIHGSDNTILWASRFAENPTAGYQLQLMDTGVANIVESNGQVVNTLEKIAIATPSIGSFISFRHIVEVGNIHSVDTNMTIINHPQLNGNPSVVLFISPLWGNEKAGVENLNAFGVRYSEGRWMILNQNKAIPMPMGANFLVLATTTENPHVFVHTATAANLSMNRTYINHPASHKRPNALLMVTQHFGEYNNREIAVSYEHSNDNWFIFNKVEVGGDSYNEGLNGIPLYAKFNVLVVDGNNVPGISAFNHQAIASNIIPSGARHISFLDQSSINNNPNAQLFFTESWISTGGVANRSTTFLCYDNPRDQYHNKDGYWGLQNSNSQAMELGRMFNVFVLQEQAGMLPVAPAPNFDARLTFVAYRHLVGNSFNPSVQSTQLNHPLLNNNPNAVVFANSNWGNRGAVLDNSNLFGVHYNGSRWEIANQSGLPNTMNPGFSFNVLIAPQDCPNVFIHKAAKDSLEINRTFLDHPLVNGKPDVHIMVTQNLTDGKATNHEIGVAYTNGRWFVYNNVSTLEDDTIHGIPEGAKFNILVLTGMEHSNIEVITHKAMNKNIIPSNQNISFLSHPTLDHNRDAFVFATLAWLPIPGGHYNPSMIALWYDDEMDGRKYKEGFWSVYNTVAGVPIAHGTVFNIFIVK